MYPAEVVTVCFLLCSVYPIHGNIAPVVNLAGIVTEVISQAVNHGKQRAIIVNNRADDRIRAWCSSKDDSTGELHRNPGEGLSFAFKPAGQTVFWCTVNYKQFWARWDVFGEHATIPGGSHYDRIFQFDVRNDGVFYNGRKIRGLDGGGYHYKLWENYDNNKNPFGDSLDGYVDGGMCNNIPNWMERKTSAVTLCNRHCIILYSDLHCKGKTSRLQSDGHHCSNFWLSFFNDRAKSVKGC